MNKVWVALILVLVFAVALAVALTLTFVYKEKKKEEEDEKKKVVWKFYLEEPESGLKSTESVLEFDLNSKTKQTVGKYTLTPKAVSHTFDETTLSGFAFTVEPEMRVKRFSSEGKEVRLQKVLVCSGFTVFDKEKKPDFVTLYHDGKFHHYSTKAELLSTDLFPFAKEDKKKTPEELDLPKGKDVEPTPAPEPTPASEPTPGPSPLKPKGDKEPAPTTPKEPVPVTPKRDEDEDDYSPVTPRPREPVEVLVDLGLSFFATESKPYTYSVGENEVKVTVNKRVGEFPSFTYERKDGNSFKPVLSYGGTNANLSEATVKALRAFLDRSNVPVLVTFEDDSAKRFSYVHKGENQWELTAKHLTEDLLEHTAAFLDRSVLLDLSVSSGTYDGGSLSITVAGTTYVEKRYEGFVSFTHRFHPVGQSSSNVSSRVYKYKSGAADLEGLPLKPEVSHVVVYFSRFDENFARPLLVKVMVGRAVLDFMYLSDRTYFLETREENVSDGLELLDSRFNRVAHVDPTKFETYRPETRFTKKTSFNQVEVKCHEHDPSRYYTKCVHKLLFKRGHVPFYVGSVRNFSLNLPETEVRKVEAFHLRKEGAALVLRLVGDHRTDTFVLHNGSYEKKEFEETELSSVLRFAAYTEHNYISLNFTNYNQSSYYYDGTLTKPKFPVERTVVVKATEHSPLKHVMKVEHTLEKQPGKSLSFNVFETNGFLADLPDEKFKSVEAFYSLTNAGHVVMVVFRADDKIWSYSWTGRQYVLDKNLGAYNVVTRLRTVLFKVYQVLYLEMTHTNEYELVYVDSENKLEKVEVKVQEVGNLTNEIARYSHTLPKCSEIRLKDESTLSVKPQAGYQFTSALVYLYGESNNYKTPVFLTLTSNDGTTVYFKLKENHRWERFRGYDINKHTDDVSKLAKKSS
ncbi:putative integral membrane protein [Theileria parva strain Muguga]|uniref:Uncharacterized protein n=1 Tax=Theileria parva TaxID=5875 RepID=Q4N0U9_THEPA|nr:putative integral membrane protein [Theileria parva strain Muguga]EAN30744.1 putative integral membrane protein [Theileria parva strain Muguga]|eukprot:XP_763027.1 hypothetical protein [Theileria parva strain Muguga]